MTLSGDHRRDAEPGLTCLEPSGSAPYTAAMTAAHAYELPDVPDPVQLAAAVDAAEHGQVIPLTRHGRPVAVIQPVDPDQAWYWTDEWQAKEREVDQSVPRGEVLSGEEFLAHLEALHQDKLTQQRKA